MCGHRYEHIDIFTAHQVIFHVVKKGASICLVIQWPTQGVKHKARLVFAGINFPYLLNETSQNLEGSKYRSNLKNAQQYTRENKNFIQRTPSLQLCYSDSGNMSQVSYSAIDENFTWFGPKWSVKVFIPVSECRESDTRTWGKMNSRSNIAHFPVVLTKDNLSHPRRIYFLIWATIYILQIGLDITKDIGPKLTSFLPYMTA